VTPKKDARLRSLGQALDVVRYWESLTGQATGAWQAAVGSDLAADDEFSHPYDVSLASWAAIVAAVSHLGTLRDSLFHRVGPNEVKVWLHTHGQLTLVRGALENASMALWLLESDVSVERILRRIQKDWAERRELDIAREEINIPSSKSMQEYEREVSDLLARIGADPVMLKERTGYGKIVKTAEAHVPAGPKTGALFLWKACSAIAHGELRGMIAYLNKRQGGSPSPGTQLYQITASVELLVDGSMAAIASTKAALALYSKRSGTLIRV